MNLAIRQLYNKILYLTDKNPILKFFPHKKREGLSAIIKVKNEEEWIRLSISSILDIVDEVIVVDNGSTDNTREIVTNIADKEDKVNLVFYPNEGAIARPLNLALKKVKCKWILVWDGDFIAKTSGENNIIYLREEIMKYNKKHYLIQLPLVYLFGDLFHQQKHSLAPFQDRLYTVSPNLKYIQQRFELLVGERYWGRRLPLYYNVIRIPKIYGFHANVKSAYRYLLRRFWTDWMQANDYHNFPKLTDYVRYRSKLIWDTYDLNEASRFNMKDICLHGQLVPYNQKFGDYPDLLLEKLHQPRYKLIYQNGKIVGRNDVGVIIY